MLAVPGLSQDLGVEPSQAGSLIQQQLGSIYLSIFTGSLIYEHYTRECEFGNFDKIKNKKHKKTKQHKKHKNFWLNFCLNKECPKLLCGLGICHRRRLLFAMSNCEFVSFRLYPGSGVVLDCIGP